MPLTPNQQEVLYIASAFICVAAISYLLWKVQGFCAPKIKPQPARQVKFVERQHPVVGTYHEDEDGSWYAMLTSERLGYEVNLRCMAAGPTEAQLERWRVIEARLPELLKQTPPPPDDDGWGNKLKHFDAASMQADYVVMKQDDNFMVGIHFPKTDRFYLSPFMHVGSDWRPYFEWVA